MSNGQTNFTTQQDLLELETITTFILRACTSHDRNCLSGEAQMPTLSLL